MARTVAHACYASAPNYDRIGTAKLRALYLERQGASKDAEAQAQSLGPAQLRSLLWAGDFKDAKLGTLTRNVFLRQHEVKEFVAEARSFIKELAPPNQGDVDTRSVQEWPDEGRKVAEAVDPAVHAEVIRMFSRYFAPELAFIFPLIVYRQNALGLDFGTTRTWVMFANGSNDASSGGNGRPVGAVSWRIRRSASQRICDQIGVDVVVEPVAEILFIAVWEDDREVRYGGDLVDAVTADAMRQGVRLLYVEIGEEQPKAQRFWGKNNGFERLLVRSRIPTPPLMEDQHGETESGTATVTADVRLSDPQVRFLDKVCFRFTDTQQWIKKL